MKLIAISGKAQSGKDTIGSFLVNKYGFTRVASADSLKRIARNIFGWDSVKDEKGRKFLQDLAMAVRGYNEDYWINLTLQEIKRQSSSQYKNLSDDKSNFVVTDLRFINEAKYLKENGAILIRVNRPGIKVYDHISETQLDDYANFDFVIENDTTLEDLEKAVDTIFGKQLETINKNANTKR